MGCFLDLFEIVAIDKGMRAEFPLDILAPGARSPSRCVLYSADEMRPVVGPASCYVRVPFVDFGSDDEAEDAAMMMVAAAAALPRATRPRSTRASRRISRLHAGDRAFARFCEYYRNYQFARRIGTIVVDTSNCDFVRPMHHTGELWGLAILDHRSVHIGGS